VTGANKSQVSSFALRAQKYVQTTNDSVGESGGVGSDDGNTTGLQFTSWRCPPTLLGRSQQWECRRTGDPEGGGQGRLDTGVVGEEADDGEAP
jgi:hypothetical protein